jgi:hypothetical protein
MMIGIPRSIPSREGKNTVILAPAAAALYVFSCMETSITDVHIETVMWLGRKFAFRKNCNETHDPLKIARTHEGR